MKPKNDIWAVQEIQDRRYDAIGEDELENISRDNYMSDTHWPIQFIQDAFHSRLIILSEGEAILGGPLHERWPSLQRL